MKPVLGLSSWGRIGEECVHQLLSTDGQGWTSGSISPHLWAMQESMLIGPRYHLLLEMPHVGLRQGCPPVPPKANSSLLRTTWNERGGGEG